MRKNKYSLNQDKQKSLNQDNQDFKINRINNPDNPLICKILIQTLIAENYKGLVL